MNDEALDANDPAQMVDPRDYGMPPELREALLASTSVRQVVSSFPPDESRQHYLNLGLPIFHEPGETIGVAEGTFVHYPCDGSESVTVRSVYVVFAGWVFDELREGHVPAFIYKGRLWTWGFAGSTTTRNVTLEHIMEAEMLSTHPDCIQIIRDLERNTSVTYALLGGPSAVDRVQRGDTVMTTPFRPKAKDDPDGSDPDGSEASQLGDHGRPGPQPRRGDRGAEEGSC